jgi:hypothetical protein
MLFIGSCDTEAFTEIDFINLSSYDLHIDFKIKDMGYYQSSFGKEFNLKKGETFLFILNDLNNTYDPNKIIETICFSKLDTNEIIKELHKNTNAFKLINKSAWSVYYKLEITDDLLFE